MFRAAIAADQKLSVFPRLTAVASGSRRWITLPSQRRSRAFRALIGLLLLLFAAVATRAATAVFPASTLVNTSATPLSVTITSTSGGTIGSIRVLTSGIDNLDFTLHDAGSCSTGTVLSPGGSCSITADFKPKYPGQRFGSVLLLDGSGTPMGSTDLLALGKGPLALFSPGQIQTVAGNNLWIYNGDNVPATSSSIFLPFGIAVDGAQNLFIADFGNNRIRRVDAGSGTITTVVGNGSAGYSGDGGQATSANISQPSSLVIDGGGNIYFTDSANDIVRRVDAITHVITTVAGTPLAQGYSGDNGPATSAKMNIPNGLALDGLGHLYIADSGNDAVRVVNLATGVIRAFAGNGTTGYTGDGGPATAAQLDSPWGVTVAQNGDVYIADQENNSIRKVSGGTITTFAGNGTAGFSGDGSNAASATLNAPASVSFDPAGDVYISDSGNNRIRKVNVASGTIQTVVGSGAQTFTGDGGDATNAGLYGPYAMVVDGQGNLIVTDVLHNRVRRVSSVNQTLFYAAIRVNRTSPPQTRTLENDGNDVLNFSAFTAVINSAVDAPTTTCSLSTPLAIAANCNVGADFAPTVVGNPVQGTINIVSNSPNAPQVLTLYGQVLTLDPSYVALTSSQNPSAFGSSVTFTATVSGVSPTPSGTVTFYDGSTSLGSTLTNAAGVATFSTTTLSLGNHNITAAFGGDSNHAPSTSSVLVQQVKNGTTITLTVDNANVVYGTTVTFKAVATGVVTAPTGTIQFLDGAGNLVAGTLVPSPTDPKSSSVSVTTSTLAVGLHSIKASYPGDASNLGTVSAALLETVSQAPTTLTLATSNGDLAFSAPFTLTAKATSSTGGIPTGTVTFKDTSGAGATLGTASLDATGTATLALSLVPVGAHSIVAVYAGDTNDLNSTSSSISQIIEAITTTTSVTSNNASANVGASVVFTATVTPALSPSSAPLSGSVVFRDAGVVLGTGTLSGNTATYTTTTLALGSHSITATYTGIADYASSISVSYTQQITLATTTGTLAAAPLPAVAGKPLTLTGKFTSSGAIPTGSVTFKDGTQIIGTGTLDSTGSYALTNVILAPGSHALTVYYPGDTNNSSVTASLALSVQQATTATIMTSSGTPSVVGLPVTLRAAVSGNGGTPGGTVTFYEGTSPLGSGTVDASGNASFVISTLIVGTHTLSAVYVGDTNDLTSTSPAFTQTVQKTTTAIALTSSALTAQQGSNVQFAAQVSSNAAVPGGIVYFYDGTTLLGSATLNGAGLAVFNITNLIPGAHNITASYPGDANQGASTSVGLSQVIQPVTAVGLSSDHNPASTGATITFTAGVSGAGTVPTGTVTFYDGTAILGNVHLNAAGVASFQTSTLSAGTHAIKVTYPGDTYNSAGASQVLNEVLQQATTSTVLTLPGATAALNTPVALNVSVTGTGGTPTGQVTFMDGTTSLGTVPLSATGTATLTVSSFGIGSHSITASYSGDTNDAASVSPAQSLTVQKATATVQVASSANPVLGGVPVTFTAVLQANYGTPTGTVTWYDGSSALATVPVSAAGTATYTTSTLTPATHTITASYSGDGTFNQVTSGPLAETVNQGTSQTTLATSSTSLLAGLPVTFSVGVTGTGGQPGGSVVLKSDGTTLATITLDATGAGSFSTSSLPANTHTITATYAGDTNHTGSAATPLTVTVTQATSTVVISASGNPAVVGSPVTIFAAVTGTGNHPTGTVTFTDGAATVGSGTVDPVTGQVSLLLSSLTVGTHPITASYGGDTNHSSSQSATLAVVINQATTSVSLASSRNPAAVGDTINFNASVTGTGSPTGGTVSLREGGTLLASAVLGSSGSVSFSLSTLGSGSHTLTADYSGDTNHSAATSAPLTEVLQQGSTTTTLISSTLSAYLHDPVTLSVAVSGLGGAAGLTATILDGTSPIATVPLDASGLGSFTTTGLLLGTHTLSASFAGNNKFVGSQSGNVLVTVGQASIAVTLAASENPAVVGDSIGFTATVTGAGNQPTGTVTIMDGTSTLQTLTLSGGTASFSTSGLAAGVHTLVAQYSGDATHNPASSQTLNESVTQAASAITLTSDKPQALTGDTVTLSVAVSSAVGQPGGMVVIVDGSTTLTTVQLDATGHGTFTTGALLAGQHNLVATYAGDASHLPAQSSTLTEVIQQVTGLTLTSSKNPATIGDTLTFSVALTGVGPTPAPVVVIMDGATSLGRVALDSNGQGTLVTAALTTGTHTLSAAFAGDTTHAPALSANLIQVVQPASSTITLDSGKNPASTSESINFTVAVAGAGGAPGGVVTILDGSTSIGSAVLNSNGIGSFTTSTLTAGTHNLTASYAGDTNHAPSVSTVLAQVVLQPTSTNVVSNNNPAVGGGSVTFTATVAATTTGTALTGTVIFRDGVTVIGTVPVSSAGAADLTVTTLAPGDHSITAAYSGDGQYGSSTSAPIVESVQVVSTLTSLSASADHLVYAAGVGAGAGGTAPLTLTAIVSGNGTPATGEVQFLDGSTLLGSAAVGSGGAATLTVTTLGPGPHILLAIYKGDTDHQTSTSNPLTVPVLQRTVVTLTASSNPVFAQAAFTLLVNVSNGSQNLLPTGTITIRDGSTVLGTAVLSASGTATVPVLGLPSGLHTLVATYDGDSANTSGLSSPLPVEVDLYPDTNVLTLSASSLLHGESLALTATLQGKAAVPPSGTVIFTSGGKTLGSAALNASGVATLALTPDDGTYSITAVYAGDSLYSGSTSTASPLTVEEPPSFAVTLNPNAMSLASKQHNTIQVTLTSYHGFTDNLALGCVGLPQAATCTFSTDHQALAADGKQTLSLTIDTGSPLIAGGAASHARNEMAVSRLKLCMLPLGGLLSFAIYRRRKSARWFGGLLAALLLLASTGLTGCGTLDVNGTPAGAYTFQITAIGANTAVTQSAPMTLTVTH